MKNISFLYRMLKFQLVFLFIISLKSYSQTYELQAFPKLVPDQVYTSSFDVVDSHYRNDNDQVYWDPYYSEIPILHFDITSAPLSLAFNGATIDSEVTDDMNQWNNHGCKQMYYDNVNFNSVSVPLVFSNDQRLFANGAFGFTELALDNIGSINTPEYAITLYSSFSKSLFGQTEIVLNSDEDPSYTWSTDTDYVDDYTINFKFIVLHEMGHLLGLGHRDGLPDDSPAEMNQNSLPIDRKSSLTQYHIDGIDSLCQFYGIPTGIEDYITIDIGPGQISLNSSYTYGANFVDVYPYGDYITSNYNWQIVVHSVEGDYVWASSSLPTAEAWQVTLGSLPYDYGWLRDQNNNVLGDVIVSGTDNKGFFHTSKLDIAIT